MDAPSQAAPTVDAPKLGQTGLALRQANATITKMHDQVIGQRHEIEQLQGALAIAHGQISCLQQAQTNMRLALEVIAKMPYPRNDNDAHKLLHAARVLALDVTGPACLASVELKGLEDGEGWGGAASVSQTLKVSGETAVAVWNFLAPMDGSTCGFGANPASAVEQ